MPMDHGAGAPSLSELLLPAWSWPWLAIIATLAGIYAWGMMQLRRRGGAWPLPPTLAWALGLLTLGFATSSGTASYGMTLFSVHMVQHLLLGMVVPILLVSGAPITLLLRALPSGPSRRGQLRRGLIRLMHSRALTVLSHPLVATSLFIASLYGLYFTPLIDIAMSSELGHFLMLVHFLLVGCLFFGPIVSPDPWPRRPSHGVRLLLLVVAVPFHAFFGVALMQAGTVLSSAFGAATAQAGLDPLADQSLAGGIAWAFGELPVAAAAAIVFAQWFRHDRRAGERFDRQAARDEDAKLRAYNEGLAALARGTAGRSTSNG